MNNPSPLPYNTPLDHTAALCPGCSHRGAEAAEAEGGGRTSAADRIQHDRESSTGRNRAILMEHKTGDGMPARGVGHCTR